MRIILIKTAVGLRSTYGNSYLCNDEVIVYREDQATIKYLIEFSA